MNKYIISLLLSICFISSCKKKDPCDMLINGVYQFPELPQEHSNMTHQEINEFFNLPSDICSCITTKGLIETCLNYPNIGLIMAGSNPQSGYDLLVKPIFRGIQELETRPDRGSCLLQKFQTLDPLGYDINWSSENMGAYHFKIYYLEIIFSQYVNLETLTKEEKIALTEKAIDVYDKMNSDLEHYGLFGLECSTVLTGRLMYQDGYQDMIDLYANNEMIWELFQYYGPTSFETVDIVYSLSKEYLNYLKNN